MEKQHGGYDKVGCVSRDLYNFIAEYKKQRIEGFDAQYMLNYMAAQEERDSEFFYRYSTDSEGHLQNLFWSDAQWRLDYDAFGGVVVFDSTYRVNKYNLPFVPFIGLNHHRSTVVFGVGIVSDETVASYKWLLHSFLEAMHQNHPRSVITDGDHAMARAILQVWPNTDHRLATSKGEERDIRLRWVMILVDGQQLECTHMGEHLFSSTLEATPGACRTCLPPEPTPQFLPDASPLLIRQEATTRPHLAPPATACRRQPY
ncbi:protein FAR1-RELATED SEQUENCE 5 [Triticum aestivum]|uniref:protein FAR1-RELATED SEQUENCE 5 n=1 Tax=Triticum aestivum TaxID=4565 RepID=UPI001D00A7E2|nr:protein FAR1-RELATED SEQUENCE 5-like [Triticum aestivum]